jgi:hypothetical protein
MWTGFYMLAAFEFSSGLLASPPARLFEAVRKLKNSQMVHYLISSTSDIQY